MSPLTAAALVGVLVFAAVYMLIRWALARHRKTRKTLDRWAEIYGLQRQPKESNRQLRRRVDARSSALLRGPYRRSGRKRVR